MSTTELEVIDGTGTRVAVIDADRRVQQSVAEVLRLAGLDVVGTAGDVRTATTLMTDQHPSVLVIDPHLPDSDVGDAFLARVTVQWPGVRVVVMGWPARDGSPVTTPCDAFVPKSAQPEEFVSAAIAACNC
jgi:DNA-binding NarL/FixJ family response regulator